MTDPGESARRTSNEALGVKPPWAAPSPQEFFSEASPPKVPAPLMGDVASAVAARIKELFYAYVNRSAEDNRGAQAYLGPSEIGTPCDRRIAMSLMRVPAVNPGGDSWASFVGTAVHAELAKMFQWANLRTGRFETEVRLDYPHPLVPRGTADLLDRTLMMVLDHKAQGGSSAAKLRAHGPSDTYRTQVHVYGYGARLRGEQVENVGIVSWPRDRASLDNLYVWIEPYDEARALAAISRVESIGARLGDNPQPGAWSAFPTADDCRFCSFHAPGDTTGKRGCRGDR